MKLDELLRKGFERGCGITLEDAEAEARFGELVAGMSSHPYPEKAARVQLLGEHLIEAAFECLPPELQGLAHLWPDMDADLQLQALDALMQTFQSELWYKLRGRKMPRRYRQTASDVLPREYGTWLDGPVHPSCLGMSTMLMAFAKRTGAPHWLAHVIKSIMLEIHGLDYDIGHSVLGFLKKRLAKLDEFGGLGDFEKRYELVLDEIVRLNKYNFHPSLVIQLKDGRWVLVDPYFGTLTVLNEEHFPMTEVTEHNQANVPERTVLLGSQAETMRYRSQLVRESGYLGGLVDSVLEALEENNWDGSSLADAVAIIRALCEHETMSWLKPLLEGFDNQQLYAQGLFGEGIDATPEMAERGIELLDRDPQFARVVVERLLAFVFRVWIQRVIQDLQKIKETAPHVSLELAQPANGIAVGTLNNLRCYDGKRPKKVGGELVLYSRSQTIWHDAMLDVLQRLRVPPLIAEVLGQMEEALGTVSPILLHPYVARLLTALRNGRRPAWQATRK